MKEAFRHIWDYRSVPAARVFFDRWEAWAIRSRLRPMIHVAGIVRRHLENILNYLVHRITNAVTEGLNAKIQWIKSIPRAASATASDSNWRSTSTAAGSISLHDSENPLIFQPTAKPEDPMRSNLHHPWSESEARHDWVTNTTLV